MDAKQAKLALEKQQTKAVAQASNFDKLKSLLSNEKVKQRFEEALGRTAGGFMQSIISVCSNNAYLSNADPNSIIASALVASSLNLPINPSLGFAYIIPYGNTAQFQIGAKGFIQLAIRSGYYKTISYTTVYEGDVKVHNKFTGEIEFNLENENQSKVVGYIAYFKLVSGFEKFLYMDVKAMENHAKRFSKTYNNSTSVWKTDFEAMAHKTIIKRLLSKFGILSVELQKAIEADQAEMRLSETNEIEAQYIDNPETAEGLFTMES